jgi:hypothetical protein
MRERFGFLATLSEFISLTLQPFQSESIFIFGDLALLAK